MFSKASKESRATMFSRRDGQPEKGRAVSAAKSSMPSIISTDLKITGNLASEGDIQLDGSVEGDVRSRSLTIGAAANVKGKVFAESVEIKGTVTGKIRARSVSLAKTAKVVGDIEHETLAIEAGAWLDGHCKRFDHGAAGTEAGFVAKQAETATAGSGVAEAAAESGEPGRSALKPDQPRVKTTASN